MPENESNAVQFQFFSKLYELPIVQSAVTVASDRYNGIKNANSVFNYALTTAEKTVDLAATVSKPRLEAMSGTLAFADTMAVQGLQKIVDSYPVTKETPEELYNEGWKKVEEIKQVGVGKVNELKAYGQNKLDQVLSTANDSALGHSINSAISLTEHAINHYLPPQEGEPETRIDGNMFQKISALSDVTRRRLYKQAMIQVHNIEKARDATLGPVIIYANQWKEYGWQKATAGIDEVNKNATWLWNEVNKVENDSKNLVVAAARGLSQQAIAFYEQVLKESDRLPEGVKKTYTDGVTYTKGVYKQLTKAEDFKDASLIIVNELYTGTFMVTQFTIDTLSTYIPQLQRFKTKPESLTE